MVANCAQLALQLEETIAARNLERKRGGQGGILLPQNSAEAKSETRDDIAKLANVSHDTVAKVKRIDAQVDMEAFCFLIILRKQVERFRRYLPNRTERGKVPQNSAEPLSDI